jgi:hypothetical protein
VLFASWPYHKSTSGAVYGISEYITNLNYINEKENKNYNKKQIKMCNHEVFYGVEEPSVTPHTPIPIHQIAICTRPPQARNMLKAALEQENRKATAASSTSSTTSASASAPSVDNRAAAAPQANEGGHGGSILQRDLTRRESFIANNVHVLKPTFQIKGPPS